MKKYKRIIFDMDYTIVIPDWSKEDIYLKKMIPIEEQEEFFKKKQILLNNYTIEYPRYDTKTLSEYFIMNGFNVDEDVIKGWIKYNSETIKDTIIDGVVELFDFLENNNISISILTNGFSETQIPRLKRTGLYDYVDLIITGEDAMKPELKAFELAVGNIPKEDCLVVGDNDRSDILGAINAGIDYYKVDKNHTIVDLLNMIKESNIKEKHYIKSKSS